MTTRKEKKNKLAIKPTKKVGDITARSSYGLWADMDRMFDDFFWPMIQRGKLVTDVRSRNPPVDIADLGDEYEMYIEMPGIPKDDINIEVTSNSIEICAEHEESKEDKDKNWLRQERSSMSFYRSFELPEEIKSDDVDAEFRDGILTVMLPKVEPKSKHKTSKVKIK